MCVCEPVFRAKRMWSPLRGGQAMTIRTGSQICWGFDSKFAMPGRVRKPEMEFANLRKKNWEIQRFAHPVQGSCEGGAGPAQPWPGPARGGAGPAQPWQPS